jgi:hypothetical protein
VSVFNTARFVAMIHKKARGPAEKRRLARRLLERQRKHSVVVAPTSTPKPLKSADEVKSIRAGRRVKRLRHKVRQRQTMASRSGLPELERRALVLSRPPAGQAVAEPPQEATTAEGRPVIMTGGSRAAEELNELCAHSRQNDPLSQELFNYG